MSQPATPTSPTGPRNAELAGGAAGNASPCAAFDAEFGVSCEREAGHDGNHRARLADGGRLAWPAACACSPDAPGLCACPCRDCRPYSCPHCGAVAGNACLPFDECFACNIAGTVFEGEFLEDEYRLGIPMKPNACNRAACATCRPAATEPSDHDDWMQSAPAPWR
jgi:hypothetical protein